ncbi:MAG: ABC transporter permease [Butyrivibrio sp.]|nr:ABC transporter permease [Butyrivibrio sp.]
MKNRIRLRVAFDFCLQEKARFRLSVLEIIAFMCLAIQIIYMIASSYSYLDRMKRGVNVPLEQLGYCYSDGDSRFGSELSNVEGVVHYGDIDSGSGGLLCFDGLEKLHEAQRGHTNIITESEFEKSGGVETVNISGDLWEVMNLKLTEGKKPAEIEYDTSDMYPDVLIYLSESFRGEAQVGDVLYEVKHEGKLLYCFEVAGFFDKSSSVIDSYIVNDVLEKQGYYPLDYGVVAVHRGKPESGFFSFVGEYAEVSGRIRALAAHNGVEVQVFNIASVAELMKSNTDKNTYYLKEAAIILAVIMIFAVSAGQVASIVTQTRNYGIWLASGASKRDLTVIIFMQNLIRIFIAVLISFALMLAVIHKIYGRYMNKPEHYVINIICLEYILPIVLILSVLTVLLSSLIPAGLIGKTPSVNLLKGKII